MARSGLSTHLASKRVCALVFVFHGGVRVCFALFILCYMFFVITADVGSSIDVVDCSLMHETMGP